MAVKSRIQFLIQTFDKDWFTGIQAEFRKHSLYNNTVNKLQDRIYYDAFFDEYGELIKEASYKDIECDEHEYFWKGMSVPSDYREYEMQLLPKGKDIANKIISVIEDTLLITANPTLGERHQFIREVVIYACDAIDLLKKKHEDTAYHKVLDMILKKIRRVLSNNYRHILLATDTISTHKDQLRFSINQKELAVLLLILQRAGFIADYGRNAEYLHFYREHFAFKNQKKEGEYTLARDINKKISDAENSNEPGYKKAKSKITQKIIKTCEELF